MSSDIVKRLRERPSRLASESNDQRALRRQAEREAAAAYIEALQAEVAKVKASAKKFFDDAGAITKNADQELEDMADALRVTLDAKNAAEARAERLLETMNEIAGFADDRPGSWAAMRARKALEAANEQ